MGLKTYSEVVSLDETAVEAQDAQEVTAEVTETQSTEVENSNQKSE